MGFLLIGDRTGTCDRCHKQREIVTTCNQHSRIGGCPALMCETCADNPECPLCGRVAKSWSQWITEQAGQASPLDIGALLLFNAPLIYVVIHNVVKYHT